MLKENKINCQKIIRFSVEKSDYKDILNIISGIEHHDDQDEFLSNLLSELNKVCKLLSIEVNKLLGRSEIQEEVVDKKRDEYETLQEAISNELEDAKDVPTKKKYLVKKDYYKITLTQFDSFKNHLSSVESNVEKMNSLLNEISKAEKDLERNNREYDDAKHLLRKLNKCIEKLQISVNNQK